MVRSFILAGAMLGGILAFISNPIEGTNAQGAEWNTATLVTNDDGSKTLTYSGKSYTIASGDLPGRYYWGENEPTYFDGNGNYISGPDYGWRSDPYENAGPEYNNLWGGGNDTYYDPNSPSGFGYGAGDDNREGRQGPCPEGWYVPSLMDVNNVYEGWCHLASNDCSENDIEIHHTISNFRDSLGLKLVFLNSNFYNNFRNTFLFNDTSYWTSTPALRGYDSYIDSEASIFSESSWCYNPSFNYNNIPHDVGITTYDSLYKNYKPVRCFKNPSASSPSVSYIEPTDTNMQVTVGQTVYNELPNTMTVTTNTVQQVENKPVLGEVSVSFGSNESAKFSKLVKVNIPVESAEQVIIKVKHAGSEEYNFEGLTTNRNASCSNGRPTSSQYNGEPITVVDGYASIYTCAASSFIAIGEGEISAQIILSVMKGTLTIGTEISNLNLGEVNVSNSAQELSGSFGANSFWVEDMKGLETGYYTTISVTDLNGTVAGHSISANNVYLKTAGSTPSDISGATASEAKVIFGNGITDWHSGSGQVNYFQRLNTSTADAGRVGKWGDNLQVKVTIPAHTPYDTYRGTITYTLYDNDL